jgi:hypothetical protein
MQAKGGRLLFASAPACASYASRTSPFALNARSSLSHQAGPNSRDQVRLTCPPESGPAGLGLGRGLVVFTGV